MMCIKKNYQSVESYCGEACAAFHWTECMCNILSIF